MSESKFETVSSCVDNYQQNDETFDEAFDSISKDSHLSSAWERYHLMGDIMRNDAPVAMQFDLSAQIAAAIDSEPTVLAPKASATKTKSFINELKGRVIQFAKPFGQLAIAASAAGIMVLGVQQNNMVNNDITVPQQVIQTNPFGGVAEPVSFNYQQAERKLQKQAYIQQQIRFQALLADHHQQVKLNSVSVDNKEELSPEKGQNLHK
ncbi:MAG: sigma-E factor negative regulatory protein RseA [Alteromonadaceae bacterium]|jgi:sigma-E factor negative regulatory protein RseA